jgi:hypothetical protein
MSDDIEEFLRRAAARRQQRRQQQRGAPQVPRGQPRRPAPPPPIPDIQIVEPEVVEAETVHEPLSEQVQEYFERPTLIAGDEVDQADEQMQTHLHQVFDHELGQLRDTSVGMEEPLEISLDEPHQAAGKKPRHNPILDMFRSPKNVRQAIILTEILNRPYEEL